MPTDVVMPQMGESIAEGTIVRWIKKVGDAVERDEPLFEISTDKVDAEIPSPVAGVVTEIRAKEGETVPVNSVVAVIGPGRGATASTKASPAAPPTTEAPRPSSAPANEAEAGQARSANAGQARVEPVVQPEGKSGDAPSSGGCRVRPRSRRESGSVRRRSSGRLRRSTASTFRRFRAPASRDVSRRTTFSGSSAGPANSRRFTSDCWPGPAAAGRNRGPS